MPKRRGAILKSPYPDLEELNEIVDDILQDDRRASEVIRRMRSLLRKAPFEPKNIDLNDLVRETIRISLGARRCTESRVSQFDRAGPAPDRRRPYPASAGHSKPGRQCDRRDVRHIRRKPHRQPADFARRELRRTFNIGSRTGDSRREAEGCVRTVFHHQGGRDGHGAFHCANHCGSAQRADIRG